MILIAFDGSDDALAAVDHVARLTPGAKAVVLTVWSPAIDVLIAPVGYPVHPSDHAEIDTASERRATEIAEAGADRARAGGLTADGIARLRSGSIARTIVAEAAAAGADAIVVGTRGLSGVRSLLMGSVSHAVLNDADRPVVVVPSDATAQQRAQAQHLTASAG
jgi:nucleotide-binding universal stress UspA family protein